MSASDQQPQEEPRRNPSRASRPINFSEGPERMRGTSSTRSEAPQAPEVEAPTLERPPSRMPGEFTGIGNDTTITEQNSNVTQTQTQLTVQQDLSEVIQPSSVPAVLPSTKLIPSTSKPTFSSVTIQDEEEADTTLKYHSLIGGKTRQQRSTSRKRKTPGDQDQFDDASSIASSARTSPTGEGYSRAMAPYDCYGYLDHPQPVKPIEMRQLAPTPYPTSVVRNQGLLDYDDQSQRKGEMEQVVATAATHITNEVFQRTLPLSQI